MPMKYTREIQRLILESGQGFALTPPPRWLARSPWKAEMCFKLPRDRRLLAIDVVPSSRVPETLYQKELPKLQREHANLRAVACVLVEGYEANPRIVGFLEGLGVGLKVLTPGLGLETVIPTDLDEPPRPVPKEQQEPWFPEVILAHQDNLQHIVFAAELKEFAREAATAPDDDNAIFALVKDTMDRLLQARPGFQANVAQFMTLHNLESLLRAHDPSQSEHVFHSFRVFLAGCPVIDRFYEKFQQAQAKFSGTDRRASCVEYSWLLAALFHDIGRHKEKEGVARIVRAQYEDDDLEIEARINESHWTHVYWQRARQVLASCAAFVANCQEGDLWDMGAVPGPEEEKAAVDWTRIYDGLGSHAVLSAFELLAEIFRNAMATNLTRHNHFIASHAVPAALAILLHDWRLNSDAKSWRLYPIDAIALPMAALLRYIDTWDDHRRRDPPEAVVIESYEVHSKGVRVALKWYEGEAFRREQRKYKAFARDVRNRPFEMSIRAKLAEDP